MRFATSLLSVCFTILAASAGSGASGGNATPAPAISLAALLAKARTASGAPYRYHIVSRSREVQDGSPSDVTTEFEGLRFLAKSCAGALCNGFYFDGERSFDTNLNGTALPLAAQVDGLQITLRAIASYAFTDPDFVKNGGTIVERSAVLREGKSYRRISVAPKLGALLDAVIDPATGLVAGVISDERKYAFEFKDQRRIERGITLPFSISLNGRTFTTYESRKVVSTPLEAPAGIVPDFSGGTSSAPMQKNEHGAIVVPCTIGTTTLACALDTGNSGLSLSLQAARKLGLAAIGGEFAEHGAGQYLSGVAKAPAVTVGSVVYPSAHYLVLHDLEQNGYDAILGADAFAHARITMDFKRRDVTIAPPGPSPEAGVTLSFVNFVPVVPVDFGSKAVVLQIDTGDEAGLALSNEFLTGHPEIARADTPANVRFGGFDLRDVPVSDAGKLDYDGRIGAAVLRHFTVTFDYARSTLTLVPEPGDAEVKMQGG